LSANAPPRELSSIRSASFRPWKASWHKSLKADCIRPRTLLNIEQAHRLIAKYVNHDNTVRLHSAIRYITLQDKLLGKEKAIFAARDQKHAQARRQRKIKRQNQPAHSLVAST
jgi:hypothetical protein